MTIREKEKDNIPTLLKRDGKERRVHTTVRPMAYSLEKRSFADGNA